VSNTKPQVRITNIKTASTEPDRPETRTQADNNNRDENSNSGQLKRETTQKRAETRGKNEEETHATET